MGKRQVLGICLHKVNIARKTFVRQTAAADFQHGAVDVGQHHLPAPADTQGEFRRQVAGPARDIKHAEPGAHTTRLHRVLLPKPVDAKRHEIIHQVIFIGDRMKDAGNESVFFGFRDFAEAEMRFAFFLA